MSETNLGTAEVLIVENREGFINGCIRCRNSISQGNFAIGFRIHEDGKKYTRFLGQLPKPICCGEEKNVIRVFEKIEDAALVQQEVLDHLARQNSTEGLLLINWTMPGSN